MKTVAASEFKTHCLSLLDDVSERHESFLILKRGIPVARVVPVLSEAGSPQDTLLGTVTAEDDLLALPLAAEAWEAEWPQ